MAQDDPGQEVMLAQEQAVKCRGAGVRKEVEGAFGQGGESEGTLVLTDRRLVYVHSAKGEKVDLSIGLFSNKQLFFSDVESLGSMAMDPKSLEIPVSKIVRVAGHGGRDTIAPKLEVEWTVQSGGTQTTEFVQQITGASRKKNLDDWAGVIKKLQAGQLKITRLPPMPSEHTLEGRVYRALGDMQEKGLMTIEDAVETRYKLDLDPDEVESACEKLVAAGLVKKTDTDDEDPFYTQVSPLAEDDMTG